MSTNSSNLKHFNELAQSILDEFNQISSRFSQFQTSNDLSCITNCGKCCFKPDIYCTPMELLPLAIELLTRGEAQKIYDKVKDRQNERCIFLHVDNEQKFQGKCTEYLFRPLVCRMFGVSARHGKNGKVDFSICHEIKEAKKTQALEMLQKLEQGELTDIPFIELEKNKMAVIDPRFLEQEYPINVSLTMILEKVLLLTQYD